MLLGLRKMLAGFGVAAVTVTAGGCAAGNMASSPTPSVAPVAAASTQSGNNSTPPSSPSDTCPSNVASDNTPPGTQQDGPDVQLNISSDQMPDKVFNCVAVRDVVKDLGSHGALNTLNVGVIGVGPDAIGGSMKDIMALLKQLNATDPKTKEPYITFEGNPQIVAQSATPFTLASNQLNGGVTSDDAILAAQVAANTKGMVEIVVPVVPTSSPETSTTVTVTFRYNAQAENVDMMISANDGKYDLYPGTSGLPEYDQNLVNAIGDYEQSYLKGPQAPTAKASTTAFMETTINGYPATVTMPPWTQRVKLGQEDRATSVV